MSWLWKWTCASWICYVRVYKGKNSSRPLLKCLVKNENVIYTLIIAGINIFDIIFKPKHEKCLFNVDSVSKLHSLINQTLLHPNKTINWGKLFTTFSPSSLKKEGGSIIIAYSHILSLSLTHTLIVLFNVQESGSGIPSVGNSWTM